MRSRLINGDIDGALEYFHSFEKKEYKMIYRIIEDKEPGGISAVAKELPDPTLVKMDANTATYILLREEDGRKMGYTLLFAKDFDGSWKIVEY